MSTVKALEPPLKLTVESSKSISVDSATAFMGDFLHNASQLNQLYIGLREEKKRLKSIREGDGK
ncbi:hypothetical protein Unana1_03449 [Umbelopsis nana]